MHQVDPHLPPRFDITEVSTVKEIAVGLLKALRWMHRHKILHRDVKRENIFYDAITQTPVLADFGTEFQTVVSMLFRCGAYY